MIGRYTAFVLLSTLSLIHTMDIPLQMPLTVAELGDDLTLTCPVSGDETGLFYWYKMKAGHMIQTVAHGSVYRILLQGHFNNPRFAVTTRDSLHVLSIQNISKQDEAAYFCQSGAAYQMTFTDAAFLVVNDHNNEQNIVYVKQSPERTSVDPGGSATLQCSLLSKSNEPNVQYPEHSVYWFRSGSEGSHPSIIYTHKSHSDEQEGRSCVHSLSQTIRNSSDSGTYYCAVVTCGHILFGEGTTVETSQTKPLKPFVIAIGALLLCCGLLIVAVIVSRNQKSVCRQCKGKVTAGEPDRLAEDEQNNVDGDPEQVNYVALDFSTRKRERWMNKEEFSEDCVYSGTRDYQ